MRFVLAVLLASLPALAAAPWDAPPFSAEPAAIAGAAAALPAPEGAGVEVLLVEGAWWGGSPRATEQRGLTGHHAAPGAGEDPEVSGPTRALISLALRLRGC